MDFFFDDQKKKSTNKGSSIYLGLGGGASLRAMPQNDAILGQFWIHTFSPQGPCLVHA